MGTDPEALQARIRALFVGELEEALEVLNRGVLRLDAAMASDDGPDLVRRLFRAAHSIKGAAHAATVPEAAAAAHRLEDTFAAVGDGTVTVDEDVVNQLLATVDDLTGIWRSLTMDPTRTDPDLLAISRSSAPVDPVEVGPTGDAKPQTLPTGAGSVRVSTAKLDALLDRAAVLVGVSGRATSMAQTFAVLLADQPRDGSGGFAAATKRAAEVGRELSRVSDEVATAAAALTFQPFAAACQGLERAARDIATVSEKHLTVQVAGGDVEVDGAVIAALRDPLLHLVRNAVDHGIERPETRRAAGKPEGGHITITATLDGGRLVVTVEDDGRGLDRGGVRDAASRRGLISMAEEELVFAPGVSTADVLTEVSGRGVGLDAVRDRLQRLGGTVELRDRPDGGTIVTLVSPLTLALMRALIVQVGGDPLCVPTAAITRLLMLQPGDVRDADGSLNVMVGGESVPLLALSVAADLATDLTLPTGPIRAVLVEVAGHRLALAVDTFEDEVDIVVKALPDRLAGLDVVLGSTTLLDGRAAFVVNVPACVAHGLALGPGGIVHRAPDPLPVRSRVLVADDTVTTRTLEVGILEAAGYEVLAAGDGAEAWDLLSRHGADLVLTDVHMPNVDGHELCRRIRASDRFADLPVVMVTSLGSDEDRRLGLEAGASAYVVKADFDQDTLLDLIERSL